MFVDLNSPRVKTALGAVVPVIILAAALLLGLTSLDFDAGYVGKVNAGTQQVSDAVTLVAAPHVVGTGWPGGSPLRQRGPDG